jgi:hypothetical protein
VKGAPAERTEEDEDERPKKKRKASADTVVTTIAFPPIIMARIQERLQQDQEPILRTWIPRFAACRSSRPRRISRDPPMAQEVLNVIVAETAAKRTSNRRDKGADQHREERVKGEARRCLRRGVAVCLAVSTAACS